MNNLIESIINKDYVAADMQLHERLKYIREKKLYEEKRIIAALHEVVKPVRGKPGQFTGSNTKADWAKYRKQHKRIKWDQNKQGEKVAEKPNPTPIGKGGKLSAGDIKARRKAGYIQAHPAIKSLEFIRAVRKYKETGKINEQEGKAGPFQQKYSSEFDTEIPRDPSSIKTPKQDKKTSSTGSKWRELSKARKTSQDRMQQVTNRLTARSAKNIGRAGLEFGKKVKSGGMKEILPAAAEAGKKIGKNVATLVKHGGQSTAGKKTGTGLKFLARDALASMGEGKE